MVRNEGANLSCTGNRSCPSATRRENREKRQRLPQRASHAERDLSVPPGKKATDDHARQRDIEAGFQNARLLQETWRTLPVTDTKPLDEIIAYDEDGLPQ